MQTHEKLSFIPRRSRNVTAAIIGLLFAATFAAQSSASVFTTSEFTVTTSPDLSMATNPPGPNLMVIEGSGPCGPTRCESLDLTFTVKNTTANPIEILFAGGNPSLVSGDPSDHFVGVTFSNDCGTSLAAGNSCTGVLHYFTSFADFNGDSGLNHSGFEVEDRNAGNINVNMVFQMTIVDPDPAPLPAALPLFATGLGGLGLLGWRRKQKQIA